MKRILIATLSFLVLFFAIIQAQQPEEITLETELKQSEERLKDAYSFAMHHYENRWSLYKQEEITSFEKAHKAWLKFRDAEANWLSVGSDKDYLIREKIEMNTKRAEQYNAIVPDCE